MVVKFDEIGYWSEVKLDIIEKYASPYSRILSSRKSPEFHHVYIDAFAGAGTHISRTTRDTVRGSPLIALDINPPFKEYYFIDTDGEKIAELKRIAANRGDVHIFNGDCNDILLKKVFPQVEWKNYRRGLCLLDPYGLDLDWKVIEEAGKMKSIDMILNFPVMDMNRNVLWSNPEGVDKTDIFRMNAFWGDESWKEVAYIETPTLFGDTVEIKQNNRTIALAFKKRLEDVAGFQHVSQPIPMKNSRGATVYYLYFASQQNIAKKIVDDIFEKYSG